MFCSFESILIISAGVLYFMLPAYLSNASGLIFGGGKPVDFGIVLKDNMRLIGDGATWRGLIAGTIIGTLTGGIQGYFSPWIINTFGEYLITPICIGVKNGLLIGFLLGFGALVGDIVGSFIKRRLKIERGKSAPFLDQLDFVLISLLFVSVLLDYSILFIIITCILTLIIHLLANTIAYIFGIKDVWY